jgi:hypothetical protein
MFPYAVLYLTYLFVITVLLPLVVYLLIQSDGVMSYWVITVVTYTGNAIIIGRSLFYFLVAFFAYKRKRKCCVWDISRQKWILTYDTPLQECLVRMGDSCTVNLEGEDRSESKEIKSIDVDSWPPVAVIIPVANEHGLEVTLKNVDLLWYPHPIEVWCIGKVTGTPKLNRHILRILNVDSEDESILINSYLSHCESKELPRPVYCAIYTPGTYPSPSALLHMVYRLEVDESYNGIRPRSVIVDECKSFWTRLETVETEIESVVHRRSSELLWGLDYAPGNKGCWRYSFLSMYRYAPGHHDPHLEFSLRSKAKVKYSEHAWTYETIGCSFKDWWREKILRVKSWYQCLSACEKKRCFHILLYQEFIYYIASQTVLFSAVNILYNYRFSDITFILGDCLEVIVLGVQMLLIASVVRLDLEMPGTVAEKSCLKSQLFFAVSYPLRCQLEFWASIVAHVQELRRN